MSMSWFLQFPNLDISLYFSLCPAPPLKYLGSLQRGWREVRLLTFFYVISFCGGDELLANGFASLSVRISLTFCDKFVKFTFVTSSTLLACGIVRLAYVVRQYDFSEQFLNPQLLFVGCIRSIIIADC